MNRTCAVLMAVVIVTLAAPSRGLAAETATTSLEGLQIAFNGESNANATYLAFAKRADQEGYAGVASLFRAAAKAEEIHLNNHAAVIKKMGAEPKADIKVPVVKSTRENLEEALKGESYERDEMYPAFVALAEKEQNTEARRSFRYALRVEGEHAKLYAEALKNLDHEKTAKAYIVCPKCGYTTVTLSGAACPICATPKDQFVEVK